ncbi:MAG: Glu-tRNA(Gln) amidotransferase subunit GatD [Nanoarchaeota archaeon]
MNLEKLEGKKVRIFLNNGRVYEGTIIKRYDFTDKNYITLKLENGYNISIKKEDIDKIEEISIVSFNLPKIEIEKNENLKDILVVSTGGTIASRVDYLTGAVKPLMKPENFLVYFPELINKANFEIISPFSKFSEDMQPLDWLKLAKEVYKKVENNDYEGVIITHGTDTLHYTASAISFMLQGSIPIAFTAAQRSSDRPSTDAIMNMLASTDYILNNFGEVAIVMHKTSNDNDLFAIRGVRARKMHSSRRDTFRPINDLPIAEFYYDLKTKKLEKIREVRKLKDKGKELNPYFYLEEKVALIKYYPGFPSEIIDLLVDKNYKGIIIEGTGFGHVSTEDKKLVESLKRAIENETFIFMTTQTLYGKVNPYVYATARKLNNLGITYLLDMIPETAFVKLSWVLGQTQNKEEVKSLMLKNIAGEIKEDLKFNEFLV